MKLGHSFTFTFINLENVFYPKQLCYTQYIAFFAKSKFVDAAGSVTCWIKQAVYAIMKTSLSGFFRWQYEL